MFWLTKEKNIFKICINLKASIFSPNFDYNKVCKEKLHQVDSLLCISYYVSSCIIHLSSFVILGVMDVHFENGILHFMN